MDTKLLIALGIILMQDKGKDGSKVLNLKDNNLLRGLSKINLDEDVMETGIEILSRSKKYMKKDEKVILNSIESALDLARGIKKLNNINQVQEIEETDFFRSMDVKDRRNMMIKEIIEVFPQEKKNSINKIMDMKNKISLLTEIMKTEDSGKGSSKKSDMFNFKNLKNLKALGELLSSDDKEEENED